MINSVIQSPIGQVYLNKESINNLFKLKVTTLEFDSTSLAHQLPIFESKIGKNKPLKMDLSFKDVEVLIGQYDSHLIFTYNMGICFKLDGVHNAKCLIKDTIPMVTALNMEADDDILMIKILNLNYDFKDKSYIKKLPQQNTMKMTKEDYKEFISTFGFWLKHLKKWLNDEILTEGIFFPWGVDEFKTSLNFKEKQMHIMLEVEEDADAFFEDNYWVDKK
jgi:hypothetical protein